MHALASLVLSLTLSVPVLAQEGTPDPAPEGPPSFLLMQDRFLRVTTTTGVEALGRPRLSRDSSTVSLGTARFALPDIRLVEERIKHPDPVTDGMLYGLGAGLLMGVGAAFFLSSDSEEDFAGSSIAFGGALGVAMGLAADAASARKEWVQLWPRARR